MFDKSVLIFLTAVSLSFRYRYSDKFVTAACSSAILCFSFVCICCSFLGSLYTSHNRYGSLYSFCNNLFLLFAQHIKEFLLLLVHVILYLGCLQ
jgi:hypothetical protein